MSSSGWFGTICTPGGSCSDIKQYKCGTCCIGVLSYVSAVWEVWSGWTHSE